VLLYHGTKDERKELGSKVNKAHRVRDGVVVRTVVITSYEVAMMDQRFLQRYEWRYMVVDEGHRIKNTHCRLIGHVCVNVCECVLMCVSVGMLVYACVCALHGMVVDEGHRIKTLTAGSLGECFFLIH
jgi:hypothetical protein